MLYDLHELQRSFLTPLAAFTDTGSQLFSHPYSPFAYTPVSRQIAATYELVHRLGKDYEKPQWGLAHTDIDGKQVRIQEQMALKKPFCQLIHFQRLTQAKRDDPRPEEHTSELQSLMRNPNAAFRLHKKL